MGNTTCNSDVSYMACEFDTHFKVFHELMSNKVLEILLVASAYDAFVLEEEGSLASKIINEYKGLNLSRPPRLTRVDDARTALDQLRTQKFDLVITMPHLDDMDPFELGLAIKQLDANLPIILLAHSIDGLHPLPVNKDTSGIDQIFIWSGDADLLLAIVKSVEDRLNVDMDTRIAQVRVLILVEDSPLYRSYFLPLIYKEVVHQIQEVLEESLNEAHRLLKMRARPKILVAESFEAALALYEKYRSFLFGVISDTRFPRGNRMSADAGYQLLKTIKADMPDLPVLLLSSESNNRAKADQIPSQFLDKNDVHMFDRLHGFFLEQLGFGDFVFRLPDGTEVARASNLRQLETILPAVPEEPLSYHASRNRFSNWIMARSEIALASKLRQVRISDFSDTEALRDFLISSIHELRKWRQKGVVTHFEAKGFDPVITDFAKIGQGSLGGKARGLAFAANVLRQSLRVFEKYPNVQISIPLTLVITSEGFDRFIATNGLDDISLDDLDDQQITQAFLKASLPPEIEDDLRAFLDTVAFPLSVRSSSLLEDAHHQPLTGLYKTFMIANNHPDLQVRLDHLVSCIKLVYASTWFDLPRRFTRSTAYRHRKERMAVIIQQIAGRIQGDFFYPAISGVARSQNYYPFGAIRPDDGMAKIAVGFGRIIYTGEGGLRFCPRYPTVLPDFSKVEDILVNAQHHFYALPLQGTGGRADVDQVGHLVRRNLSDALEEAPVKALVSTYLAEDNRIRDSAVTPGPKIVTFASVLKYNTFPLAAILTDLLALGKESMGCHLELEFAVDLLDGQGEPAQFHILQMRPMAAGSDPFDVEVTAEDINQALFYSTQALGHGKHTNIADIVYVKPDAFDAARTEEMAADISRINLSLNAQRRPYLLMGPGRWGSFDRWLGIPVKWNDINGAGAFIELRNEMIQADPSQGSHFFQQITTQGLPYMTITEGSSDVVSWGRLLQLAPIEETALIAHVRFIQPLLIKCDGRSAKCVVMTAVGR